MQLSRIFLATMVISAPQAEADYVIRRITVYDGTGEEGVVKDVAIKGDRISAVGGVGAISNAREIEGDGLVLSPGFIDLHSHSDRTITKAKTRGNANYVTQGVTSIVTGNCGSGPVDVGAYLAEIDQHGAGTNVLHLIPHGSLRRQVLGDNNARESTATEIERMKKLVSAGMLDGAWGMSTGLIYLPGSFANTDELVELSKIVSAHQGIYVSHMRNEGTRLLDAITETLDIGRRAEIPVHISHFKASGRPAWGLAADAVNMVKDARENRQMVTADQYPYTASSTSLAAMVIPAKYRTMKFEDVLKDPAQSKKMLAAIEQRIQIRGNGKSLFVAGYKKRRAWQGKNLSELAKQEKCSVLDLVVEIQSNGGASMVNFGMQEEEVRLIMQQPFVATASDGSAKVLEDGTVPHPRNYGCFPRKIGRYAIEGKTISLAHAIRSATGLPADILRLPQRGYIKPGYFADIVIFDPKKFRDTATFEKPHQYATGVQFLLVNGELAMEDGKVTGVLAGKSLRHQSAEYTKP